ncbi:thioredoxin family protein [Candidatus Formimonas warabiya]|uniref:Thioredoxin n=1 Tax=Formimonas warabiya TaxID=1761012 RepID=A0A3G1KY17_FORW1|nr:thioredoxin family protein [Candidatus Formimonas warabiya]ATW27378.1 hypothetical protein DCMF_23835 [Candidatus Formimonas warabiya]
MTQGSLNPISPGDFDQLTFDSPVPVTVFFGAERCQVCKELLPTVEEIARDYAGKMNFYWVDVDEYKTLATRFRLRGIPQILIFHQGEIKERIGGLAEKEAIQEKIDSVLGV